MGGVIRRDAHFDVISNDHLDPILLHPPGKASPNGEVIVTTYFHDSSAQNSGYLTFQLYEIISTQSAPYSFTSPSSWEKNEKFVHGYKKSEDAYFPKASPLKVISNI